MELSPEIQLILFLLLTAASVVVFLASQALLKKRVVRWIGYLIAVGTLIAAVLIGSSTANSQAPDSTRAWPIDEVEFAYGESPLSSGLAVTIERGDLSLSATEDYFEGVYTPFKFDLGPVGVTTGPSGGLIGQLPYGAWIAVAGSGPITGIGWVGIAPGTLDSGLAPDPSLLFVFGQLAVSGPLQTSASVSVLSVENSSWQLLPALEYSPTLDGGLSLKGSVTLDGNEDFAPLFLGGFTLRFNE